MRNSQKQSCPLTFGGKHNLTKKLEDNEKLLVQAFVDQNNERYHESFQKLEQSLKFIIGQLQNMQKSSHFQMSAMPIMKDERQLISDEAYNDFWKHNELILSQNFERNAYLALLMQQLQEDRRLDKRRWDAAEEKQLLQGHQMGMSVQQLMEHFPDRSEKEIRRKIYYLNRRRQGYDK